MSTPSVSRAATCWRAISSSPRAAIRPTSLAPKIRAEATAALPPGPHETLIMCFTRTSSHGEGRCSTKQLISQFIAPHTTSLVILAPPIYAIETASENEAHLQLWLHVLAVVHPLVPEVKHE